MTIGLAISFDMRAPFNASPTRLYAAAIEQAEWADVMGFDSVTVMEHHGVDDGYLPSPMVLAAAMAARTSRIAVRIAALILPFHDPIRVAEDLAVLDIISGGRLVVVVGAGYRQFEFEMFGVELDDRVRLVEEGVDVLRRAWTGEPFEYVGRTAVVRPCPVQRPGPPILLGGSTPGSARRAARIADGYRPTRPELLDVYMTELRALGKPMPNVPLESGGLPFIHVSEDPERDWALIAPHALHETNSYAAWADGRPIAWFTAEDDADSLAQRGGYLVLTPEECIERVLSDGAVNMRPLMGGLDPTLGWASLELFAAKVLPQVTL